MASTATSRYLERVGPHCMCFINCMEHGLLLVGARLRAKVSREVTSASGDEAPLLLWDA